MKNKFIFLSLGILILFSLVFVMAEDNLTTDISNSQTNTNTEGPITQETTTEQTTPTEQVEFNVDPGMTPDNPLYFVKDTYQRIVVGNNPERALDYREQKIAEAKAMVEEGKPEQAQRVLDRAIQYGDIVEKEVSPNIKDKVEESADKVESAINNMKKNTEGEQWKNVNEGFDKNIEKGKQIGTASELVAKISELCNALAQLDPLQYSDTCRAKDNSPNWMKEQDKALTTEQQEQAKIFFDKLSQCFETPKDCDCKGMGVQKFEDFCLEKSAIAIKCNEGDESACKEFSSGADPTDLLPDYLISTFKKVESKYMKSEMNMYMPPECEEKKATTPEECGKIMFSLNAPQECIDAGLTGKSKEDEIKCNEIMFKSNTPKECLDAGISPSDKDGARKCAKIMFSINAPQECIDAGIIGESRDDEKKCRDLMSQGGQMQGSQKYAPKFNRDCKAIQDANEKMKCFEEFYNNAQVNFREDFAQKGVIDQNTGEKITPEEDKARQECRNKGMNTILEYESGKRIIICVNEGEANKMGQRCQSQQETEKLKQDCKNRGQEGRVEDRGGCPWVICVGGDYRGEINGQTIQREVRQETKTVAGGGSSGVKCPDGVCDAYERMNSFACPEDCGGQARQLVQEPRQDYQQPQQPMQPENRIDQPQQPENRIDQPQQPLISGEPQVQQPTGDSTPTGNSGGSAPVEGSSGGESVPASSSVPVTGGVIMNSEPAGTSGNLFWDYWFSG